MTDGDTPTWTVQLGAFAGVAGTVLAAFFAGWQGWKGRKAATPDAAIIAGDIMSTKPMTELTAAVTQLTHQNVLGAAAQDRAAVASDRAVMALDRAIEAQHRTDDLLRDLIKALEGRAR